MAAADFYPETHVGQSGGSKGKKPDWAPPEVSRGRSRRSAESNPASYPICDSLAGPGDEAKLLGCVRDGFRIFDMQEVAMIGGDD